MSERETITARLSARPDREATGQRGGWTVREFDAERDADAVSRLDTSYASDQVYAVHRSGDVVALAPLSTTVPHSARYPIGLAAGAWTHALVAVLDDRVRGFLAWRCDPGRRMTIAHFHVDRPYRRRGGGRRLIDDALDRARRSGAVLAWLETSSANHPAITAAHRLGFEICGFDTTRHRGTPRQGEVAVYMARAIDGDARA